jgi:hypothetical protein
VAAATGRELDANLNAGVLVGYLLFVLLSVATGVAFGALLHNSAAAIVLYFALPIAFALLGRASTSLGQWVDSGTTFDWVLNGEWSGHTPQILATVIPLGRAAGGRRTRPDRAARDQLNRSTSAWRGTAAGSRRSDGRALGA